MLACSFDVGNMVGGNPVIVEVVWGVCGEEDVFVDDACRDGDFLFEVHLFGDYLAAAVVCTPFFFTCGFNNGERCLLDVLGCLLFDNDGVIV